MCVIFFTHSFIELNLAGLAAQLASQRKTWSAVFEKKSALFTLFSETVSKDLLSKWKAVDPSTHPKSELYQVQGKGESLRTLP